MKTTKRFENAVIKLYNAFHAGELNAMDRCCCAVGNLCNNSDKWNESVSGYSTKEMNNIEHYFMYGVEYFGQGMHWDLGEHEHSRNKDSQFKGLCAVVKYLAELDNIPNPMDYTRLFETENNKPKYELWNQKPTATHH